jgi:hypothetical protein
LNIASIRRQVPRETASTRRVRRCHSTVPGKAVLLLWASTTELSTEITGDPEESGRGKTKTQVSGNHKKKDTTWLNKKKSVSARKKKRI